MKALRKGFLKGCPNLSEELVTKYLNPSPATAKGHMKRPKKGIRSTQKQVKTKGDSNIPSIPIPVAQAAPHPLPIFVEPMPYNGPAYNARREVNYIPDDKSIANVFCFGAFADKVSGVVYNDLTGNFPFMSIDGSVCFFVLYHYEINIGETHSKCRRPQHFCSIQGGIRNPGSKGVQTKDECNGQPSDEVYQEVSHQKRMRFTTCGATQPPRQRSGTGNPNF
jgi:hypothetical protein